MEVESDDFTTKAYRTIVHYCPPAHLGGTSQSHPITALLLSLLGGRDGRPTPAAKRLALRADALQCLKVDAEVGDIGDGEQRLREAVRRVLLGRAVDVLERLGRAPAQDVREEVGRLVHVLGHEDGTHARQLLERLREEGGASSGRHVEAGPSAQPSAGSSPPARPHALPAA